MQLGAGFGFLMPDNRWPWKLTKKTQFVHIIFFILKEIYIWCFFLNFLTCKYILSLSSNLSLETSYNDMKLQRIYKVGFTVIHKLYYLKLKHVFHWKISIHKTLYWKKQIWGTMIYEGLQRMHPSDITVFFEKGSAKSTVHHHKTSRLFY